jgi:hypothetical protein
MPAKLGACGAADSAAAVRFVRLGDGVFSFVKIVITVLYKEAM